MYVLHTFQQTHILSQMFQRSTIQIRCAIVSFVRLFMVVLLFRICNFEFFVSDHRLVRTCQKKLIVHSCHTCFINTAPVPVRIGQGHFIKAYSLFYVFRLITRFIPHDTFTPSILICTKFIFITLSWIVQTNYTCLINMGPVSDKDSSISNPAYIEHVFSLSTLVIGSWYCHSVTWK